jgi:hypothetical protein
MVVSKLEDPYSLLLLGYTGQFIEWWLYLVRHFNIHASLSASCSSSLWTLFSLLRVQILALFAACVTNGEE